MPKLLDYLNHLDQHADARTAHAQDPQQAMQNFGLSPEEQVAMQSGDKEHVAKALGISSAHLPSIEIPQF